MRGCSDGMVVVVLGAGGPTGRECVKRLLEDGEQVKAVVRDPKKYEGAFPADRNLQVVPGDVTDASSLRTAFDGARGVIFAASGKTYFSASEVDQKVSAHTAGRGVVRPAPGADR